MELKFLSDYLYDEDIMHSKRVAKLTWDLALSIGFSKVWCKRISELALYHDIGKSQIPHGILTKAGKLKDREFAIIKKHAIFSENILLEKGFCTREADIVLYHHENYNGEGYPKGLKGSEIPIESQIISICDYVDARMSVRVYRKDYLSKSQMITDLAGLSNGKFKKELVDSMMMLLRGKSEEYKTTDTWCLSDVL